MEGLDGEVLFHYSVYIHYTHTDITSHYTYTDLGSGVVFSKVIAYCQLCSVFVFMHMM